MKGIENSFRQSIASGLRSLLPSGTRRYYVLEHKTASALHAAGSTQKIIVDTITLGRDPRCQVRFAPAEQTISRQHAAIRPRAQGGWELVHLSQTNPTLHNGVPVTRPVPLRNGDEIRLGTKGPVLGFLAPQGADGLTKSLRLTQRLNLFTAQALRPYRRALLLFSLILLLIVAVGATVIVMQHRRITAQDTQLAQAKADFNTEKQRRDSLVALLQQSNNILEQRIADGSLQIQGARERILELEQNPPHIQTSAGATNRAINQIMPYIYYIQTTSVDVTTAKGKHQRIPAGTSDFVGWSGTGFLLSDGRFVSARHVIRGWDFWSQDDDDEMLNLNLIANNGGKVKINFMAINCQGDVLYLSSDQFRANTSKDEVDVYEGWEDTDGEPSDMRYTSANLNDTDWAYAKTNLKGGIPFDANLSHNLEAGTPLTILGFPRKQGVTDTGGKTTVQPLFGNANVGTKGLYQDLIVATGANIDTGNSGGPAMVLDSEGNLVVVGITSAIYSRNLGYFVPIAAIK